LRTGPAADPGQPRGQDQLGGHSQPGHPDPPGHTGPPRHPGQPGHPALDAYARAAGLLTGRPDASVEDGITWIRETLARLEVPGLGAFGVRPDQAEAIVAQAARSSSMQGNPVPLSTGALRAALLAAI